VPKDYQKLWKDQLKQLARENMARFSVAPKVNCRAPKTNFDLVVTLIYSGDEDDQKLREAFSAAKLNVEDPFHWWQLLHDLIMIHTDRPLNRSRLWTQEKKNKLERDCVNVGRRNPATDSIVEICRRLKNDLRYDQTPENLQAQISRFNLTDRIKKKLARFVAK
jgi:hypothetical protein